MGTADLGVYVILFMHITCSENTLNIHMEYEEQDM